VHVEWVEVVAEYGAAVGPAVAEAKDVFELLPGLHRIRDPQSGVQHDGRVVVAALGDAVLFGDQEAVGQLEGVEV